MLLRNLIFNTGAFCGLSLSTAQRTGEAMILEADGEKMMNSRTASTAALMRIPAARMAVVMVSPAVVAASVAACADETAMDAVASAAAPPPAAPPPQAAAVPGGRPGTRLQLATSPARARAAAAAWKDVSSVSRAREE